MAHNPLPTRFPGQVLHASYLNQNKANTDELNSRVNDIEAAAVGGGDVVGPSSVTDEAPAVFDGTSGKLLKAGTPLSLAGIGAYLSLAGNVLTRSLINLASSAHVTGRLPWSNVTAAPAATRLLGRGSSGGAGDWEPISLGTNLSMSGTTLNASGGGGGGGALDDLSDVAITSPTTDDVLTYDGSGWVNAPLPGAASSVRTVGITIDGAGDVITTGIKGFVPVPFSGTITGVTLLSTDPSVTSGSIVVDVWKDTYANYPPTDADSITASAVPTISAATKAQDLTLTGWTTSVTAGDVLAFHVDSVTDLTRVTVVLTVEE